MTLEQHELSVRGRGSRTRTQQIGARFGYCAALLNAIAFLWYGYDTLAGTTATNPITWWLWFGETLVGLLIYADRTRDMSKWLVEAVSMIGVACVGGYLIYRVVTGHATTVLEPVEPVDFLVSLTTVGVFIFWLKTRKRLGSSVSVWVFQVVLIAAALPLIRSTIADPTAEPLVPWLIWTGAFTCQTMCVLLRWDGWTPLLNPINYVITHLIIVVVVWQCATSL